MATGGSAEARAVYASHVLGGVVFRVVIGDALRSGDVPDRLRIQLGSRLQQVTCGNMSSLLKYYR